VRVLVHAHTHWSYDGVLSPDRLGRIAARRGFGAILVADHAETLNAERYGELVAACRAVSGIHVIPGMERSFDGYHVCALGLAEWVDADDLATWADRVRAAGGLVSCAHPIRYRYRIPPWVLDAVDLVEVWNAHRRYNGSVAPDPGSWRLLRPQHVPIASQDVHRARDFNSVGLLVADVTDPGEVLEEIRAGRVRLTGPLLQVDQAPTGVRAAVFTALQRVRPLAWAGPVAAYRLSRRLRRYIMPG
jgi:PHP domain